MNLKKNIIKTSKNSVCRQGQPQVLLLDEATSVAELSSHGSEDE